MPLAVNMDEPAGILVKTTLVDFPGLVACSFFLPGCNLCCPYCYNTELIRKTANAIPDAVSLNQLFMHLEKRKNVLAGIAISGGEPLLSPKLEIIIQKARSTGYRIKLDTNGTQPERLAALIKNPLTCPDYIAMDVKTVPEKYSSFSADRQSQEEKLKASIAILSNLPADKREFRTVLVPGFITEENILKTAELLPENARWFFARFRNENCLDPEYNSLIPYSDDQINAIIQKAEQIIPGAILR